MQYVSSKMNTFPSKRTKSLASFAERIGNWSKLTTKQIALDFKSSLKKYGSCHAALVFQHRIRAVEPLDHSESARRSSEGRVAQNRGFVPGLEGIKLARDEENVRQKTLRNIVVESPATCRRVLNRAEPSRAALFPSSMSRGEYRVGPDTWSESLSMRKGPECSSPPFARERAARDFHESRSLPVPWKRGDIFLNDDGKKSTA